MSQAEAAAGVRETGSGPARRLTALLTGYMALMINSYAVIIALPAISQSMKISFWRAGWILLIGILCRHSSQVVFGHFGDVLGRRRVFNTGLLCFTAGSVFCALAPGYGWLLAARALQGLASGMIEANFAALVTETYPAERRGRALGIATAVLSAAAVAGLIAGGFVTTSLGFRYMFLLGVPFSLAGAILCHRVVPEVKGETKVPLDIPGALLLVAMLGCLGLLISHERALELASPSGLILAGVTAVVLVAFIFHEKYSKHPVLDRRLFRIPEFLLSNLAHLVRGTAIIAVYYATPFLMEELMGMHADWSSLVLAASIGTAMLLVAPSGILSDRKGTLPFETSGLAFQGAGIAILAFAGTGLSLGLVIAAMVVIGIGSGLFESPNYSAVMGSAPVEALSTAGGFFYTMETIGSFLGIAFADDVMEHWLSFRGTDQLTVNVLQGPQFEAALRTVFLVAFFIMVAALAVTLFRYRLDRRPLGRAV